MKQFFLVLLTFNTCFLYATSPKYTYIGISIAPAMPLDKGYYESYNFSLSYSLGLSVSRKIDNQFGFTSGIQFTNVSDQGKLHDNIYNPKCSPYGCSPFDSTLLKYSTSYSYSFIELPLIGNITLFKQIGLTTNFGFLTSYLIHQTSTKTLVYIDNKTIEDSGTQIPNKRLHIYPLISLGIERDINYRLKIKVEPFAKNQMYHWLYGVNFTLFKRF